MVNNRNDTGYFHSTRHPCDQSSPRFDSRQTSSFLDNGMSASLIGKLAKFEMWKCEKRGEQVKAEIIKILRCCREIHITSFLRCHSDPFWIGHPSLPRQSYNEVVIHHHPACSHPWPALRRRQSSTSKQRVQDRRNQRKRILPRGSQQELFVGRQCEAGAVLCGTVHDDRW
jgi:hypothetical protein